MPQDFQTTFIPKKPVTDAPEDSTAKRKRRGATSSIFTIIGIGVLLIGGVFSGGMYLYSNALVGSITAAEEDLAIARESLETGFLADLQALDARMRVGGTLLSEHISVSPFFRFLENSTLKSIQYSSFAFSFQDGAPTVTMSGQARRYQSIAEQSNILGQSPFVTNHIFSNFSLTDQGRVAFNLVIKLADDIIYFEESLDAVPRNQTIQTTQVSSGGATQQRIQINSEDDIRNAAEANAQEESANAGDANEATGDQQALQEPVNDQSAFTNNNFS